MYGKKDLPTDLKNHPETKSCTTCGTFLLGYPPGKTKCNTCNMKSATAGVSVCANCKKQGKNSCDCA